MTTLVDMPLNSDPGDHHPRCAARPSRTPPGTDQGRRRRSGRRVPGNPPTWRRCSGRRVRASSASWSTRASTEFAPLDARRARAARWTSGRARALDCWSTPRTPPRRRGAPPRPVRVRGLPALPPTTPPSATAIAGSWPTARVGTGARTHLRAPVQRRGAARLRAAPGGEVSALSAETCPHYLAFDRGRRPRRRHRVQVLPARSATRPTARRCGRPRRRRHRPRRVRPLAVHPRPQAGTGRHGHGDFGLAWGGIASLQIALAAVDGGAGARRTTLRTSSGGWLSAPVAPGGLAHKGRIEVGRRRRPGRLAPDQEFAVDVTRLAHRDRVCAYAGRRLTGVVRRTWLRGESRSTSTDRPRSVPGRGRR